MRVRSFYFALLLMLVQSIALASPIEDLQGLQSQALSYLEAHYDGLLLEESELEINVSNLDSRLRLAQCDNPLTFEARDNGSLGGRVSVKTQCTGTTPWTVYLHAAVDIFAPVVVASQHISKGTVIGAEHLETLRLNLAELQSGFVNDRDALLGKAAGRNLQAGKPIRDSHIKDPLVVARGDLVTIEAKAGTIVVSSQGTAMSDGSIGQQISVRNDQSKQIVSGEVVASGRIRVAF